MTCWFMPTGTPLTVPASLVWLSNLSGLTKESTTRLTEGTPSPRSIIQWLAASKSVMLRTVAQVQASLPQCHVPYTWMGVAAAFGTAANKTNAVAVNRAGTIREADLIEAPFGKLKIEGPAC